MKRNVIKLGQSTLVISLPSKWAEENNIRPKSELEVVEEGGSLHIQATGEDRVEQSLTIELSEKDWNEPRPEKYVQRILATAYKQGMSTIVIRCKAKHILDYVESRVEGFIGLEIVEQKKDALVLKSVVSGEDSNFDTVMARAINLTLHISSGTYDALATNDKNERTNLLRLERTHNKVTDYLKRALAMRRATWEDKYLYSFIAEDERLVDEYKYLLQSATKKLHPKTLALLKQVNEYVGLLFEMYHAQTPELIMKLSHDYVPLRTHAKAYLGEGRDVEIALHLYNTVVAIYELGETILEWKKR